MLDQSTRIWYRNDSARQFRQPELEVQVSSILRKTSLAPRWPELEITESTLMNQSGDTPGILQQLKEMGIRLAVDNFGTDYSACVFSEHFPGTG